MTNGNDGMSYSLPSRDLIADSIEDVVGAQWYDGVIAVVGCDKNMPGAMMALARLNRPGMLVYGGTIKTGEYKGKKLDIVSAFEALGQKFAGTISDEDYEGVIKNAIPGAGACGGMYTANTMASSMEAMGLTLPNSSSYPATHEGKKAECLAIGAAMKVMLEKNICPRDIMTRHAFENAMTMVMVMGGVDTIFGYPGGAIMPTYDALYDYQDKIKHILVRHEQGAGHAAQGYARMTNRAGVALVTSGPGATNLMTPIADALLDSTPMVCLVGQVKGNLLGTDAFQECDIIGVSMPITKWNYQVVDANEIPEMIAKAFHIAETGRPGPVLLDLTRTAQTDMMTIPFEYPKKVELLSYNPRLKAKQSQIELAAKMINEAKKPYIFAGHGVLIADAKKELDAFLLKTDIPVATTLLGMSCVPFSHPNYVGWLGMHGNYGANVLTDECDLVIAIGMRFDDRVTGDLTKFIQNAKVVHIEIDPAEIGKNVKTEGPVVGDAKQILAEILPLVNKASHKEWRETFRKYDAEEFEKITKKDVYHDGDQIRMGEAITMLSNKTKGQAVTVTDVGQHQMVTNRYYQYNSWNSLVTSGGAGTMGFALPAAFGAKVAAPDREVIAIIGD
ncbi:hypothetical protein B566_EDAN019475, partial [Ephemera danica]